MIKYESRLAEAGIAYNLLQNAGCQLIVVSKTRPLEAISAWYELGQRDFGENRVPEMCDKYEALPKDIRWHLIGHLQSNKVRAAAPFVHLIHAVDSWDLLREIDKQAKKCDRIIDVLIQFYIAKEATKYGFSEEEFLQKMSSELLANLPNVRICGVMGMATFTEDKAQVRSEFRVLHQLFERLKSAFFADEAYFKTISMGMSGDYDIAVEEGSTMVRIGSLLFP